MQKIGFYMCSVASGEEKESGETGMKCLTAEQCHGSELSALALWTMEPHTPLRLEHLMTVGDSAASWPLSTRYQCHTHSPTLEQLRMSPGLPPCPMEDKIISLEVYERWRFTKLETVGAATHVVLPPGCDVHPSPHRSTWMRAREGQALWYWQTEGSEILRRIISVKKKKLQVLGGGETMQNKGKGRFS